MMTNPPTDILDARLRRAARKADARQLLLDIVRAGFTADDLRELAAEAYDLADFFELNAGRPIDAAAAELARRR